MKYDIDEAKNPHPMGSTRVVNKKGHELHGKKVKVNRTATGLAKKGIHGVSLADDSSLVSHRMQSSELQKESVEQVDELSIKTLSKYNDKASKDPKRAKGSNMSVRKIVKKTMRGEGRNSDLKSPELSEEKDYFIKGLDLGDVKAKFVRRGKSMSSPIFIKVTASDTGKSHEMGPYRKMDIARKELSKMHESTIIEGIDFKTPPTKLLPIIASKTKDKVAQVGVAKGKNSKGVIMTDDSYGHQMVYQIGTKFLVAVKVVMTAGWSYFLFDSAASVAKGPDAAIAQGGAGTGVKNLDKIAKGLKITMESVEESRYPVHNRAKVAVNKDKKSGQKGDYKVLSKADFVKGRKGPAKNRLEDVEQVEGYVGSTGKDTDLGHLAARHYQHTIYKPGQRHFDYHDGKNHVAAIKSIEDKIKQHHGADAVKAVRKHSKQADAYDDGKGGNSFHKAFAKKHLGGAGSDSHKKYMAGLPKSATHQESVEEGNGAWERDEGGLGALSSRSKKNQAKDKAVAKAHRKANPATVYPGGLGALSGRSKKNQAKDRAVAKAQAKRDGYKLAPKRESVEQVDEATRGGGVHGLNTWGPTRSSVMRIRKQNDADRSQARKEKEPELLDDAKDNINHYLKKSGGLPKTLSRYDSNFYQSAIQQIERISGKTAAKKEVAKAIKKHKGVKESVEQVDEAFPSHAAKSRADMRKIVNAAKRDAQKANQKALDVAKAGLKLAIKDMDDGDRAIFSKEVLRLQKTAAVHAKLVANIKEDVEQVDEKVVPYNKELLARMIDLVQDYLVDMSSHGDITEKDYKSAMAVIKKIAGDKVAAEVSSDKAISKLLYGRHGVFGTDIMRDRQGLSGRKKNKSGKLSKVSMSNFKKDVERAMSKHQKVTRKLPESVEQVDEGEFNDKQIDALRVSYASLKTINPTGPAWKKVTKMLDSKDKETLEQIAFAKIKFLSQAAARTLESRFKVKLRPSQYMGESIYQMDELSGDKLHSYISKAMNASDTNKRRSDRALKITGTAKTASTVRRAQKVANHQANKRTKRELGIQQALWKQTGKAKVNAREELSPVAIKQASKHLDKGSRFSIPSSDGKSVFTISKKLELKRQNDDAYMMDIYAKDGKKLIKNLGSHPSFAGALKYAATKGYTDRPSIHESHGDDV